MNEMSGAEALIRMLQLFDFKHISASVTPTAGQRQGRGVRRAERGQNV
jgi:hypothetical protein